MKKTYICKECNKEFSRDNCGKNPKFCCIECFTNFKIKNRKHYICKNCGKEFIRHNKDKNKTYCFLKCFKEYKQNNKIDKTTYKIEYNKKYYIKNKKEMLKKSKEYRKKMISVWREKWKLKGKTVGTRYGVYKATAKRRNIKFNITIDEFKELWNKPCNYCGDEIIGIGIDRIDNSKGYEVGNIVPCCSWCNRMKLNFTKEDFIKKCEQIYKFNK